MRVPPLTLWADEPSPTLELVRAFLIADVFTGTPLEGNQLGIFPDGRALDDGLMLKATRELGFSETVFFLPPADSPADAQVRIFTPGGEIPFAGHPTLGSAWILGEILGSDRIVLATGAGLVPVELERDGNAITFGWMSQPIPRWAVYDRADEMRTALGASEYGLPIEEYDNGPRRVCVEIASEAQLAGLAPDMDALARLEIGASCFTQTRTGWLTRMFAPHHGVPEDPATGSAAGPLAVHLARHGRVKYGEQIELRQGEQIHRPSVLYARADGTGDTIERVAVGGRAVLVAHGAYRLA